YTHALIGVSSLWLLTLLPSDTAASNIALMAPCVAFGALLPDLDAAESKIKHVRLSGIKPFELPALALHQTLGHRGLLHSLVGLGLIAVAATPLGFYLGWQPVVGVVWGYASHVLADAATRSGIPLLYPKRQCYHLLPRGWRFVTGSQAEEVLFALAAVLTLLLLLSHLSLG
ncbi:MAG: metal-dependent hydrolase, partial [Armatimonadota bacterium]|nr:metal-dependent hydrolase [Armatimonadota bacterium]